MESLLPCLVRSVRSTACSAPHARPTCILQQPCIQIPPGMYLILQLGAFMVSLKLVWALRWLSNQQCQSHGDKWASPCVSACTLSVQTASQLCSKKFLRHTPNRPLGTPVCGYLNTSQHTGPQEIQRFDSKATQHTVFAAQTPGSPRASRTARTRSRVCAEGALRPSRCASRGPATAASRASSPPARSHSLLSPKQVGGLHAVIAKMVAAPPVSLPDQCIPSYAVNTHRQGISSHQNSMQTPCAKHANRGTPVHIIGGQD